MQEARANPRVFANQTIGQVPDHVAEVIGSLSAKPAVVGHSFGGLLTQVIAGRGLSAASVAIDPAPFRGVLPLPISSLRSAMPVLANPANRRRAVTLTLGQFTYGWASALPPDEAARLYETYHVAGPGAPLFQATTPNLNPSTEARVDTLNPDRGPLLIIAGVGSHRPLVDRQRLLQEAAAKCRHHGNRADPQPRSFPHDRQRLARRPDARVRQAFRLVGCEVSSRRLRG